MKARMRCVFGVAGAAFIRVRPGREVTKVLSSRTHLERWTIEGDSPVNERQDPSFAVSQVAPVPGNPA